MSTQRTKKRTDRVIEVMEKNQKSPRGKWWWRCKAGNGRILFSSETFNTKYHCKRQAWNEFEICIRAKLVTTYKERVVK